MSTEWYYIVRDNLVNKIKEDMDRLNEYNKKELSKFLQWWLLNEKYNKDK